MPRYIIQIEVIGRDRASGPLRGVSSALGGMAVVAGGILAAQLFSRIARGIVSMATEAFNAASMFQELTIRMETLIARQLLQADASLEMKDALAQAVIPAQELLDWVKRIAVTTPFTVASIARTVSMAQAFGFTTDEAKSLTLAIGDFTAGMGLGDEVMVSILRNFGQMITQSKVTGTELRDLARGALFPITDVLKRMQVNLGMTNISLDDFRKLAAKGKVDVREFFLAFEELVSDEFGGSMERLAKTVRGITQNFKDFIQSILGAEVLGPALNRVTDRIATALEGMLAPEVLEQFSALGESLGGIAEILIDTLLPDVETTKAGVVGFLEKVNALAGRVERAFFALDIGHPFLALQQLGLPGGQISSFLDDLSGAMDRIKEAVAPIVEFLQPALDAIAEFVSAHGEEIKQFFTFFAIALGGLLAATAVPGIIAGIGAAIAAIAALVSAPIVLIAGAIALLALAWQNNWFGIQDTLTKVWENNLKPALEALSEWLGVNIPIALEAIGEFWETRLKPAMEDIALWFGTNVPIAMKAISDFWSGTLQPAIAAIVDWFETHLPPAIEFVLSVFQGLVDFWEGTLVPGIENVITLFRDGIFPAIEAVANFVGQVFTQVWETLVALWENILLPILKILSDIFTKILIPIFLAVANVVGAILGKAFEVFTIFIEDAVIPILKNLWEWFSDKVIPIFETIAGVVTTIVVFAFKLFKRNVEAVTTVLKIIWNFVKDKLTKALKRFKEKILDPLKATFDSIATIVGNLVDKIHDFAAAIRNFKLPRALTSDSPTPLELGLLGINEALGNTVKRMKMLRGEFGRLNTFGGSFALAPAPLALASAGGKTIIQNFNIEAHYRTVQPEADLLRDIRTLETLGRSRAT